MRHPSASSVALTSEGTSRRTLWKLLYSILKSCAITLYVCRYTPPHSLQRRHLIMPACLPLFKLPIMVPSAYISPSVRARGDAHNSFFVLARANPAPRVCPTTRPAPDSDCSTPKKIWTPLVSDLDQVISQLLNSVRSSSRLDSLRIVCDEDRLCGLDENNTFTALHSPHFCQHSFPLSIVHLHQQ